MYKVGDIVICKTFPKIVNGIHRNEDPNMTIDKYYVIVEINNQVNDATDLQMLQIMGERGACWYWSDYFYSKIEIRKQKLKKICSKLEK